MILLDTHIWVWLADENKNLSEKHRKIIEQQGAGGFGISVISCWEVAKLLNTRD